MVFLVILLFRCIRFRCKNYIIKMFQKYELKTLASDWGHIEKLELRYINKTE